MRSGGPQRVRRDVVRRFVAAATLPSDRIGLRRCWRDFRQSSLARRNCCCRPPGRTRRSSDRLRTRWVYVWRTDWYISGFVSGAVFSETEWNKKLRYFVNSRNSSHSTCARHINCCYGLYVMVVVNAVWVVFTFTVPIVTVVLWHICRWIHLKSTEVQYSFYGLILLEYTAVSVKSVLLLRPREWLRSIVMSMSVCVSVCLRGYRRMVSVVFSLGFKLLNCNCFFCCLSII